MAVHPQAYLGLDYIAKSTKGTEWKRTEGATVGAFSGPNSKLFCHIKAGVTWREILHFADDTVSVLFVEFWSLEAERVKISHCCAALTCGLFGLIEQLMSVSLSA